MRLLKKLLKKPDMASGIVAVSFLPYGFAIAVTRYTENSRPQLMHCEFVTAGSQQILPQLEILVKEHQLEDYDCHVLLAPEQYRSISIEAPAVNSEEIKQAVRWRIADFLDYPVDQATIDFYPLPRSNRANSTSMLEVVACNNQLIVDLTRQCRQAGLNIKVIDIQEMALRNLATLLPENQQGIALLHLQKEEGRVIIQKRGELFLSRKISNGFFQLAAGSIEDLEPLLLDQFQMEQDNLALEIQRSFDFVENYFDIPPITSLATVLMPANTQSVINALNSNHGITARIMDLSAIVDGESLLSDTTQNLCAPVIGASLRRSLENLQS